MKLNQSKDNKPVVVEAVGTMAVSDGLGNKLRVQMVDAVHQAARESEEIWASDLSDAEKQSKIEALNDPEAIKGRMLGVRASLKEQERNGRNVKIEE